MRIQITSIVVLYDPKDSVDILYGIDTTGTVYWYRNGNWTDENRLVIKTEGWVPLVMELSKTIEARKETNDQKQGTK